MNEPKFFGNTKEPHTMSTVKGPFKKGCIEATHINCQKALAIINLLFFNLNKKY